MAWLFFITTERDAAEQLDDHRHPSAAIASVHECPAECAMLGHTEAGRIPARSILYYGQAQPD